MYPDDKTPEERLQHLEARVEGMQGTLRLIETHVKWILFCAFVVAFASITDLVAAWNQIRVFF